jgi:peptide/nickel transport system substrate-binding protein
MPFVSYLKRPVVFALACALGSLAVSACSKVSTSGTVSGAPHSWTHPGVLRIGEAYDPKSLNVALDQSVVTGDISYFIYSYAVRYDDHAKPVPDALSEIPTVENGDVSKDGKTLTYKLRRDIRWQDGPALTCRDLVFTWHYVIDPKTNVSTTEGFRDIGSIDCRDAYTAVIHMKRLYAPYLQQLWGVNSNVPILPEHLLASYLKAGTQNAAPYNSMPIGSGPFRVIQWERGTVVRMAANPNFYLGKPKLNEVDIYSEPDENTLETQVQTHELDMLARGSAINWPRYEQLAANPQSALTAELTPSFSWDHIDFNLRDPILSDVNVRRALAYATSRKDIIQKIMHGAEEPAEIPQSASSWAYTDNVVHYPYDPAKAKATLEADGWRAGADGIRQKNGKRLEFEFSVATENTLGKAIEELVQREWHDVGVLAQVKNYPTSELYGNGSSAILMGGHYEIAELGWTGGADPDIASIYSGNDMPPNGQNFLFWNDPVATNALSDALQTVNRSQRRADYIVFDQQFAKDVPSYIIGFRKFPFVYNNDLKDFTSSPVISPFWDPWEYSI